MQGLGRGFAGTKGTRGTAWGEQWCQPGQREEGMHAGVPRRPRAGDAEGGRTGCGGRASHAGGSVAVAGGRGGSRCCVLSGEAAGLA
jgi:hypothetical protein